MSANDSGKSLSDGGTFVEQPKVDRDDKSLGDAATFAGSSKRRSADASLGDERTLGGGDAAAIDTVFDDIEVVDLAARYKTEGTLGRGGMGEVLLALDTRLDRKVAIKRILGEAARSKTAVSRFLTEAKAIAALNHPNVVQIYDYGRAADGPFLIMEYVDGSSLLDRCRDGALPLEQAVDLACQLCDGLAKAHDLGIVHRDIKPANVLLTKDGLPKLTDFGLAKAEAADHQMTMTGAVLGTPDFMPPEQRKDAALVDHRSDLWSLAATLYQMVTGRSPKIIRFDLLPSGITSVLGKALEESKDHRYQSAREFRDALKTSLVAAAPAAAELGEGQCPACGVKNDSSRRFCRGCGESLEASCLSCSKPMPMWEEICGQCGTKQAPLLENRRGEMAARQAEAEGLLKDYDFDKAERLTVSLREESDPRLKQLVPWATDFVGKIGKARDAQLAQAGERIAEALKHEASFDYPSAIHALEQVPEILRGRTPDGHTESVATALSRVVSKQTDVENLESSIKARIASRELSGLLPHVEKLRDLRPDRADVEKLFTQLAERQQKLAAQRDEAVRLARTHLDGKDYESAVAVLRKVDGSVETPEVRQLRDSAQTGIKSLQNYLREISQAVSQKQLDGLLPKVQAALAIKPGHAELVKLLDSLQARESKVAAGIQEVLDQAAADFKACQFAKAAALLQRVPEDRRNSEATDLLERCEYLAMTRAGVIAGFEGLPKISDLAMADGVNLKALAVQGRSYVAQIATHGLSEPLLEQWCVRCETANEKREAAAEEARRAAAMLRRIFIGVGTAAAVIMLAVAGLWVRSTRRAADINAALARSDWQAALTLDPDSVDAILGQAKAKLAAEPPDIDYAFVAIDRAEKLAPGRIDIKTAQAAAYVARALEHVRFDRLAEAAKDLEQASRLTASESDLRATKAAIANVWLSRAVEHAQFDRVNEADGALKQAQRYLNDEAALRPAKQALATRWLNRASDHAKAGRLEETEKDLAEARQHGADDVATRPVLEMLAAECLKQAEFALAADKPSEVRAAVDRVRKYGVDTRELRILLVEALVLESRAIESKGQSVQAAAKIEEAVIIDRPALVAAINKPVNAPVQAVIIAERRKQFDDALVEKDWELALKVADDANSLDSRASGWVGAAIATQPIALTEMPAHVLSQLPAGLLATVPASVLRTFPPSLVAALPQEAFDGLPLTSLSAFSPESMLKVPAFKNSLGMEMRLIPPGSFRMGDAREQSGAVGHPNATPRTVTLTHALCVGVTEVTNAQWCQVMGQLTSYWKDDELPVNGCSWEEAGEFCQRLSALPAEREVQRQYRLPTEAEWEYSCRAGSKTRFSFGDDESEALDYAWCEGNSGKQVHPVRRKKPNAWGLYDMHGNVYEWCSDWYADYQSRDETNPKGPNEGYVRVFRGGCWIYGAGACGSAHRAGPDPSPSHYGRLGFRVVMQLPAGNAK